MEDKWAVAGSRGVGRQPSKNFHHVEPEKDALVFLSLDFSNIQTHVEDDFAWTLVDTTVQGKVRKSGETFNKTGFQTFLFKKVNGEWLAVHTHSSSRNRAKD